MINLLSGGVAASVISAGTQANAAGVAMGVYEKAKARNDTDAMERAMSYATPRIEEANKQAGKIGEALKEAREAAREEEKKEQKADAAKDTTATQGKDATEGGEKAQGADAAASSGQSSDAQPSAGTGTGTYAANGSVDTSPALDRTDVFILEKSLDVKV